MFIKEALMCKPLQKKKLKIITKNDQKVPLSSHASHVFLSIYLTSFTFLSLMRNVFY